jgi:tRNA (cytidine/uridine-2'-O-)-methyltransferase
MQAGHAWQPGPICTLSNRLAFRERQVKRAGLDYWEHVNPWVWLDWEAFEKELPNLGSAYFFSARAKRRFWDEPLGESADLVLIFGGETTGLPEDLHRRYSDRFVGMPIRSPLVRSLNLSTAVGIALYEVMRQRST